MTILFIVGIPLTALSFWLYLKFCPKGTSLKSRIRFEIPVFLVELLACAGAAVYSWWKIGQGPDRQWWPVIAFIHCILLIPSILVLAASIRRMVYRHPPPPIRSTCFKP